MVTIVKKRYILNDTIKHRESCEYVMIIIKAAKIIKLDDIHNQLNII